MLRPFVFSLGWPLVATIAAILVCGCDSAPPEFTPPKLDPAAASAACLAEYDANKDGLLDKMELTKAPGIASQIALYDANSDGKVSKDELTARLTKFVADATAITTVSFQVMLDGKPLEGAAVRLVPEKYLGEAFKPATGTTDAQGFVSPEIAAADLNKDEQGLRGVHVATYRIEVTHPTIAMPAKFNTATEYGLEVAPDTTGRGVRVVELKN